MKDGELLKKLKELTEAGYIETEQLERIEKEYFKEEAHEKKLMLSFALLGVLFVGLGLISICAFNWNQLSKLTKVIIAFIPLIVTQITLCWQYKKGASRVWIESLCLGVGLTFLLAIGLIYQVYQLSIGLVMICLITFVVMLPIIYCCDAYYLALLCVSGIVLYAFIGDNAFYNILVVLILPYYWKCLKDRSQGTGTLTLALIVWLIEFLFYTLDQFEINHLITYMLVFVLFTRMAFQPLFRKIGWTAYYLTSFFMVITHFFLPFENIKELLPTCVILLILGGIVYRSKDRDKNRETGILLLQPLLVGIGGIIGASLELILLFDLCVIGSIVYLFLIKGNQEGYFRHLKYGTRLLCLYALCKLFSASVGLIAKGVGFILIGIALLGANVWLKKLGRRDHNE